MNQPRNHDAPALDGESDDPTVDGTSDDPDTIAARQTGRPPEADDIPPDDGRTGPQDQPDAIALPGQDDDPDEPGS